MNIYCSSCGDIIDINTPHKCTNRFCAVCGEQFNINDTTEFFTINYKTLCTHVKCAHVIRKYTLDSNYKSNSLPEHIKNTLSNIYYNIEDATSSLLAGKNLIIYDPHLDGKLAYSYYEPWIEKKTKNDGTFITILTLIDSNELN